jgi:catechol 2,3-dioxygenase-like lactoylglutathione lyase family enzyme
MIVGLDHVQVAIPAEGEEAARAFYLGVLGLAELEKPEALRPNGGFWAATGGVPLHVGLDPDVHPARKAHAALATSDLAAVADALEAAGHPVRRDAIPGRLFTDDPAGNRLEIVEAA